MKLAVIPYYYFCLQCLYCFSLRLITGLFDTLFFEKVSFWGKIDMGENEKSDLATLLYKQTRDLYEYRDFLESKL